MSSFHGLVHDALRAIPAPRLRCLRESRLRPEGMIEQDGRACVNMASNDYLGLARDPAIQDAAARAARDFGGGAGASRLITGTHPLFAEVERKLAALKGTQSALIFNSGFQANLGLLATLLDGAVHGTDGGCPRVQLLSDRLNHASLYAGVWLSGARQRRFRHNDLAHLERLLATPHAGGRIVVTESVFSMEGDQLDVPRLRQLARQYDAFLMIDEAHASGVLGHRGMGLCARAVACEEGARTELVMGTFGKALGGFGAYVACSSVVRDYLVNRCGGLIYSTALPPAVVGAMAAALDKVPTMDRERQHLHALADRLRRGVRDLGLETLGSTTQIVPVVLGDDARVLSVARAVQARGYLVGAIRPPAVPVGTARLRVTPCAQHSFEQIDGFLSALSDSLGQVL